MAKIQDKLYNRIIEGKLLSLSDEEKSKLHLGSSYTVSSEAELKALLGKVKIGDAINYLELLFLVYGFDEESYFAVSLLVDDAIVTELIVSSDSVVSNEYAYVSNIAFTNALKNYSKIYITDYSFDTLPSSLIAQLKIGDIIYSISEESIGVVDDKNETICYILRLTMLTYVIYGFEDNEWSFSNDDNLLVEGVNQGIADGDIEVGTKLYKHVLNDGSAHTFYLINSDSYLITYDNLQSKLESSILLYAIRAHGKTNIVSYDYNISIDQLTLQFFDETGMNDSIPFDLAGTLTDTVTPL